MWQKIIPANWKVLTVQLTCVGLKFWMNHLYFLGKAFEHVTECPFIRIMLVTQWSEDAATCLMESVEGKRWGERKCHESHPRVENLPCKLNAFKFTNETKKFQLLLCSGWQKPLSHSNRTNKKNNKKMKISSRNFSIIFVVN